jgi:hypothetical protein
LRYYDAPNYGVERSRPDEHNSDMLSHRVLLSTIALTIAFCASAVWAAKDFVMPKASNAATYSSKDSHPNEKVAAAVDVYDTAQQQETFKTRYTEDGILPVFLIITNDGEQPISVKEMRAQLVTASRTKLEALDVEEVFRRVSHISGRATNPRQVGPITLPGHGPKNKKAQQQYDELTRAHFEAQAVEPHATRSGFLFFDIADVKDPVAGSRIYLTGLRDSSGNELMYFEIPVTRANAAVPTQ